MPGPISAGEPGGGRFAVWWLLTLTGSLGVFIAGDLASFYLAFALVSLAAWGLVVHDGTPRARRAGVVYLVLAVLGEICLLMAFVLLAAADPGRSLAIRDVVAALPASPWRGLTLALLIAGFGLKMGLVPLHVWLPLAHPAAPMPASAVLSGVIVKAGVIGLIRFLPVEAALPDWGGVLAALGLLTAYLGRRDRHHAGQPEDRAGLLQRQPDGARRRRARHGPGGRRQRRRAWRRPSTRRTTSWPRAPCSSRSASSPRPARPPLAGAAAGGGAGAGLRRPAADRRLSGEARGERHARRWLRGPARDPGRRRQHAADAAIPAASARWRPLPATRTAPAGLVLPWLAMALAAVAVPWALFLGAGIGSLAEALAPAALWAALWPVLLGGALAALLRRFGDRLPQVPEGDIVVIACAPRAPARPWASRWRAPRACCSAGRSPASPCSRSCSSSARSCWAAWVPAATGLATHRRGLIELSPSGRYWPTRRA